MTRKCPACGSADLIQEVRKESENYRCNECGAVIRPPVASNPAETVLADNPAVTVLADNPAETILADNPAETIMASGPAETILADNPAETIMASGPAETVLSEAPGETLLDQPQDTAPPAKTLMENHDAPAETFAPKYSHRREEEDDSIPADWSPGDVVLGLYEVGHLLGEGGMGKVFMVHHRNWNVDLAVKSPKPEELKRAGGVETFEREAETWVNLGLHPNTVSCYYVRRLGGIPRVFAEYVDGGSLKDWIERGEFTETGQILDVLIQFAWGLDYSHQRGLVHQDIKPANVMMTATGIAKVTDFGLAKARAVDVGGGSTGEVAFSGMTPAYCSPEQAEKKPLTFATDIWSWAVSALEIYTGELTWMHGAAAAEALEEYGRDEGVNESTERMPARVFELLRKCFSHNMVDRPASMNEIAETLLQIFADETGSRYPRPTPKAGRTTADSLNNSAVSFVDLGRMEDAMQRWEDALQKQPHHPEATYNLGLMKWRGGDTTDMELTGGLEEMASSHGERSEGAYYLGLVHLERDDCQKAVESFERIRGDDIADIDESLETAKKKSDTSRRLVADLAGCTGEATSVSVTHDGALALAGCDDGKARLWNTATGELVKTLDTGGFPVTSVCLDPEGNRALTGSHGAIGLWDISTGAALLRINGHGDWINAVAFANDNKNARTAGWDGSIKTWDISSGALLNSVSPDISTVALCSGSDLAMAGSEDGKTLLVSTLTEGAPLSELDITVGALSLSHDGTMGVVADLDDSIHIINTDSGRVERKFAVYRSFVISVAVHPSSGHIVTGGHDKTVRLWSAQTGGCIRTFVGHTGPVSAVDISSDGKTAVSAGWDGSVKVWSLEGNHGFMAPMMLSKVEASEIVFSSGMEFETKLTQVRRAFESGATIEAAKHLVEARNQPGFSRAEEAVTAWGKLYSKLPRKNLNGGWEKITLHGHDGSVNSVALSSDGAIALTGGDDNTGRLWNLSDGSCAHTLSGHGGKITSVALAEKRGRAVTASSDGLVKTWDITTGEPRAVMEGHFGQVNCVAVTPDGKYAITGGEDSGVKLWHIQDGVLLRNLRGHTGSVNDVSISRDGLYAASVSHDRTARVWELSTGSLLRVLTGHNSKLNTCAFAFESGRLITGGDDGTMVLWDLESSNTISVLRNDDHEVISVSVSQDGKYLLSCDTEKAVRLWNINTGENLRAFMGHTRSVNDAKFSMDGRFFLSCGGDSTLKVWTLDWELDYRESGNTIDLAEPLVIDFLALHTPYTGVLPEGRKPFEEEINVALTKRGRPTSTKKELERLFYSLGCAGFGSIDQRVVLQRVKDLAREWTAPPVRITAIESPDENANDDEEDRFIKTSIKEEEAGMTKGFTNWLKGLR